MKSIREIILLTALIGYILCPVSVSAMTLENTYQSFTEIRVPAEWEPQEAIWIQWPGRYEKQFEIAFSKLAEIVVQYEKLHIICDSELITRQARNSLTEAGVDPDHPNLVWHLIPNDSAWMRDNGPVYVIADGEFRVQNWKFNAWGGAFGSDIPYAKDDAVSTVVAEYLSMPVDQIDVVHERGNLEFNGVDTVIANWSVLGDPHRNPGYDKKQLIDDFRRYFGVSNVIVLEGIPQDDLTKGHVDGIARFINADTVVVPQCTDFSKCKPGDGKDDAVYNNAATTIKSFGFNVIRDPMEATVQYAGKNFDTNYTNWLVGNGFVLVVGFGNQQTDAAAKARIESYFPGRDVHVVEMLDSWASGGGVHCHTNDQPAAALVGLE